mgnify:FL=1|tara:strand:- start:90 stop:227 length:138 start_codon:yes stop_codon:yes gene_type:complete
MKNEKQKAMERLHDEYRRQLKKEENQENDEDDFIRMHTDWNQDGA